MVGPVEASEGEAGVERTGMASDGPDRSGRGWQGSRGIAGQVSLMRGKEGLARVGKAVAVGSAVLRMW